MNIAIIPARAGSKSLPGKNMRLVKDKPLLRWAVEAAQKSAKLDRVFVSSDSTSWRNTVVSWGDKVRWLNRPPPLAEDVPTEHVILNALDQLSALAPVDTVVTLQCTTPLMSNVDIDGAITMYETSHFNSVVSVTSVREHPYWMFNIGADSELYPFTSAGAVYPDGDRGVRQNLPILYRPNGAIYVTSVKQLQAEKTLWTRPVGAYYMPFERSYDVDTEIDLKVLEALAP